MGNSFQMVYFFSSSAKKKFKALQVQEKMKICPKELVVVTAKTLTN